MRSSNIRLITAAVCLAAGTASFHASAATQWEFDRGSCDPGAGANVSNRGNVCNFTPVGDPTALDAKITAWSNTGAGGGLETAIVRDFSGGAGITHVDNGQLESTTSPNHAMDNQGQLEFLLFDFQGQEVRLDSVYLGYETDSDLSILAYIGPGAPDLGSDFVVSGGGGENLTGAGGWVSVAQIANATTFHDFSSESAGISSSYWLVGAYAAAFGHCYNPGGCGEGQDHVKLWDVKGHIFPPPPPDNNVPAPATALMLGGLLPLMWRRRRA